MQTEAVLRHQPRRRRSPGLSAATRGDPARGSLPSPTANFLGLRLADLTQGRTVRSAGLSTGVTHEGVVVPQLCAEAAPRLRRAADDDHRNSSVTENEPTVSRYHSLPSLSQSAISIIINRDAKSWSASSWFIILRWSSHLTSVIITTLVIYHPIIFPFHS